MCDAASELPYGLPVNWFQLPGGLFKFGQIEGFREPYLDYRFRDGRLLGFCCKVWRWSACHLREG